MKVGLYFGSFNPVHIGHLIVANYIRQMANLDEVWFVVSPHNPFKTTNELAHAHHRVEMVKMAISNPNLKMKVCDIELQLPTPSYTMVTLEKLTELYPDNQFELIMGSDNLPSLHLWKRVDELLANYCIHVYRRELEVTTEYKNVKLYNAPLLQISATWIREQLANNRSLDFICTPEVLAYIDFHQLYK